MPFDGSTLAAATSAPIAGGTFIDSFSVGNNDVDMVRIELVAGRLYTIDVDNGTAGDFLLRVFDAFGNEVKRNDDGARSTDNVVFSLSPYTEFVPGASGTYYIAVSPYYLSDYNPTTTAGRVTPENPLATTAGILTVTDFGTAIFPAAASINAITSEDISDETDVLRNDTGRLRVEMFGAVDSATDVDIARVDLRKGDVVVVDVNGLEGNGTVLRVFDDTGVQIGFDDDAGFGEDSELIFVAPVLDDYYIGISGEGNSTYNAVDGTGTVAGAVGDFSIILHLNPTQIGSSLSNLFLGSEGADYIVGLAGNDTMDGGAGRDTLSGGDDNDVLNGGANQDVLYGDAGDDNLVGGGGSDIVIGGLGNDTLNGGSDAAADVVAGGQGNDSLSGQRGDDTMRGDEGNDTLRGGTEDDVLFGGAGLDELFGSDGDDLLQGDAGNDTLTGSAGDDTLVGGADNDLLNGGGDDDLLGGENGNDTLDGSVGNDTLVGGAGNDLLQGGTGIDVLFGGAGTDTLTGGSQADVFEFVLPLDASSDLITDFAPGSDVIDLVGIFGVGVVNAGNLSQFVQVTPGGGGSDSFLAVDADGATGGFSFSIIALVEGVTPGQLFNADNFLLV